MATYKPIKKWLLPMLSIFTGLGIGFSVIPSKQEYHYNSWVESLDEYQGNIYDIKTSFKRDNQVYSQSQGIWSSRLSKYNVTTPISDGSNFIFSIYFTENKFYMNSGEEWKFGKIPHRLLQEFVPLDNPFKWTKKILSNADRISFEGEGEQLTYQAHFKDFSDIEFRGIVLKEQENTILEMKVNKGQIDSIQLMAKPIRPPTVAPLVSYPDEFIYQIEFESTDTLSIDLPPEADMSEELE